MYYEIYDEIRQALENQQSPDLQKLINKSYLDIFYDLRSEITHIYDENKDRERLIGDNYTYLFSQKIINGIAKAIFLGLKPGEWMEDLFLPSGRMKVPSGALEFDLALPCLYLSKAETISYAETHLMKWEDEFMKLAPALLKNPGIIISREGFRAHLYRILEIIFSYRHDHPKRSRWVEFIHELMIHGKSFTQSQLAQEFSLVDLGDSILVKDVAFKTLPYLEYHLSAELGTLSTQSTLTMPASQDPLELFSAINQYLIYRLPICHFSIGELMFIAKDEYSLNQYYDWYIKNWTTSKDIQIIYLDNELKVKKEISLDAFPNELKRMQYSIVLGFKAKQGEREIFYSAEPKMLKY